MTVSAQETIFQYVGNGVTTTFAYNCQVLQPNDLFVYADGVEIISGITKNGIGSLTGGTVVFSVAPASGVQIILEREVALERTTDYQQNGDFLARVVNPDFNRIWMALQQIITSLGRALRFPKEDVNPITELPNAAARANNLLGFDASGNPTAVIPSAQSATALQVLLATIAGSSLLGFIQAGSNAVANTAEKKMRERVSVFDFMTTAERDDVSAGTALLDVTAAVQAAATYVASITYSAATTSGALTTSYTGTSSVLWFPKGVYRLSSEVILSGYLDVRGDSAILKQFTDAAKIFTLETYLLEIQGLQFVGGASHIDFYNANLNSTMVRIHHCQFFLSRSYAIVTSATGGTYSHLSANLQVDHCRFIACNKVINNVCDQAVFKQCWFQVSKTNFTASSAAFMNHGTSVGDPSALTRMHLIDCFLIPDLGVEGVDRVNSARWVDNYGSFTATNCRFGGEDGGLSILWHYGAPYTPFPYTSTEVVFVGCFLFGGPDARADSCVVAIQGEIPNRTVFKNCSGPVGRPLILNLSSLAIPAYMTAFEAATSRKAYEYFKIDIRDVQTDINAYSPARPMIPDDLYKYLISGRQTVVARVATQSITNGFATNLVSFDTISYDNVGAFDIANPTRLVMPKGCSKMRISLHAKMAVDAAAKAMAVTIMTSGSVRIAGDTSLRGINGDSDRFSFSVDVQGPPGSYWVMNIQHLAAAALNLLECQVTITPLDHIC